MIAGALIILALASGAAADVTTGTLLNEMADLENLAAVPATSYETVQYSSYDHRSTVPSGPHWFDNADGFGGEPVPNFEAVVREPGEDGIGEYLVCDVKGPGAIVRTWTAAMSGMLRVYLDGGKHPLYEGPAEEFWRHPYNPFLATAGIDPGELAVTLYQRNAAYCPIPFAKGCRIVWEGRINEIHFYHVQVRMYEEGTKVESFSAETLSKYKGDLETASEMLADPMSNGSCPASAEAVPLDVQLEENQVQEAFAVEGPKAVCQLTLRVQAERSDLALRQTVMHVFFDDSPIAQIQTPIGDFFGAAPGVNPYQSLPFTVEPDGTMTCRYVMPFERNAKILFENLGGQPVHISGKVLVAPYTWDPERSMHFRARWRIDHDMVSPLFHPQDVPYVFVDGQGTFVGAAAYLLNPCEAPGAGGSWWGEGDEKIFIDDDIQPSFFGTGSEDYFNYAWSENDIFIYPYCGQPRNDGPANRGFVTNYRWHVLDAIPFKSRFRFFMEFMPHHATPGTAYARMAYYYARPGAIDDHTTITRGDVREQKLPEDWTPIPIGSAANSVFFQAEDCKVGEAGYSEEHDPLWSAGTLLRWAPGEGGSLRLIFPVAETGRYALRLACSLDPRSGKAAFVLDDNAEPVSVVDLYRPHRTLLRCIHLCDVDLEAGEHTIEVRPADAEQDVPQSIGVDFIWLQRL